MEDDMHDEETVVPFAVDRETKSLSENGEGGADKETNTDPRKGNERNVARVTKTHHDTRTVEAEASDENRTLREIFDRDKTAALVIAKQLRELIAKIELDEWFVFNLATDENRPMPALRLAQQLCDTLQNIECVKLIIAQEV
jgi:hypothetical protein